MIFCERCKTYHEPGGPELCAPPYPSGNEKMIRECTLAIIGAIELHALVEFAAPGGGKFTGMIRELNADSALIDFNHPLAGKTIRFEVEVVGIL